MPPIKPPSEFKTEYNRHVRLAERKSLTGTFEVPAHNQAVEKAQSLVRTFGEKFEKYDGKITHVLMQTPWYINPGLSDASGNGRVVSYRLRETLYGSYSKKVTVLDVQSSYPSPHEKDERLVYEEPIVSFGARAVIPATGELPRDMLPNAVQVVKKTSGTKFSPEYQYSDNNAILAESTEFRDVFDTLDFIEREAKPITLTGVLRMLNSAADMQ